MTTKTTVPEPVRRAIDQLQALSADEKTRQLAEDRERALIAWNLERAAARREGLAEGEAKGEAKARQSFARTLLANGFSIEKTATLTGLSVDKVYLLAKDDQDDPVAP